MPGRLRLFLYRPIPAIRPRRLFYERRRGALIGTQAFTLWLLKDRGCEKMEERKKKVAVLIPCYNEAKTIEKVVRDYREVLPEAEIYVYDNNSTDGTDEVAARAGAIVRYEYKQGKGNVIRTMFREIEADCYGRPSPYLPSFLCRRVCRTGCCPTLRASSSLFVCSRMRMLSGPRFPACPAPFLRAEKRGGFFLGLFFAGPSPFRPRSALLTPASLAMDWI